MHAVQRRHRFCSWQDRRTMNILRSKLVRPLLAMCLALSASASLLAQGPAPAPATPPPAPTLEQRIAGLEAYLGNGDPAASLKDAKGAVPAGLTTPAVGVAGPGHNGFMMICAALVL